MKDPFSLRQQWLRFQNFHGEFRATQSRVEDPDRSEKGPQHEGDKFVGIAASERWRGKKLEISRALRLYVGCCKNLTLKLSKRLYEFQIR